MRVNLITEPLSSPLGTRDPLPIFLTITPAYPVLGGDYRCQIEGPALMGLLRDETNLPATALDRFEGRLGTPVGARLLSVELSDNTLTNIGYFVD